MHGKIPDVFGVSFHIYSVAHCIYRKQYSFSFRLYLLKQHHLSTSNMHVIIPTAHQHQNSKTSHPAEIAMVMGVLVTTCYLISTQIHLPEKHVPPNF